MAFTASKIFSTVWGDKRMLGYSMTADANSGALYTGFNTVEGIQFSSTSMVTDSYYHKVKRNVMSAATAGGGHVFFSGFTSGDDFFLTIVGH